MLLISAIGLLCFAIEGDEFWPVSVFAIATLAAQLLPLGEGGLYLLSSSIIDFGIIYLLSRLPAGSLRKDLAILSLFSLTVNGICYFFPSVMAAYSLIGVAFYLIVLAVIITRNSHGVRDGNSGPWLFRHAHKCD